MGSSSMFPSLPGGLSEGQPWGTRGQCRDTSWCLLPSVWEGSRDVRGREEKETVRQHSSRQTDGQAPEETREPGRSTDSLRVVGVGSTLYATRAGHFFPSPRGGDMCFSISNISL